MATKLSEVGSAFCEMWVEGNVQQTLLTILNDWYAFEYFSNSTENGVETDLSSQQIKVQNAGTYFLSASISFSGTPNQSIEGTVFVNSLIKPQCHFERRLGASGDIGAASFFGILELKPNDVVKLYFRNVTAGGGFIIGRDVALSLISIQRTTQ